MSLEFKYLPLDLQLKLFLRIFLHLRYNLIWIDLEKAPKKDLKREGICNYCTTLTTRFHRVILQVQPLLCDHLALQSNFSNIKYDVGKTSISYHLPFLSTKEMTPLKSHLPNKRIRMTILS